MVERSRARCMSHPEEAGSDGVDLLGVKFVKVASVVDEDGALEGLFGEGVVADTVMGEIVKDFQGQHIAGCGDVGVPVEYGAIDDFHVICVSACGGGLGELRGLEGGERGGYFYDFEFCSGVDVWFEVADVVQHVQHQGSVASA